MQIGSVDADTQSRVDGSEGLMWTFA